MKRYVFSFVLTLIIALGCFGYGGYKAWQILSAHAEASAPEVLAQKKADYEADLKATALDPAVQETWKAADYAWPKVQADNFAAPSDFDEKYRYVTPDGFPILSDSSAWNLDMLKNVYAELIKNKHGDEIKQLDAVFVCSKSVKFKDDALGEFVTDKHTVKLSFRLPGLLVTPAVYSESVVAKTIWISQPKGKPSAQSIAYVLSHEYGHFFHSVYNAGFGSAIERTYTAAQKKLLNSSYIWLREEIEANDFATIMGSPDSFEKKALPDVRQRLAADLKAGKFAKKTAVTVSQVYDMLSPLAFTGLLPASQVNGLTAAYYSLIPSPPAAPKIPAKLPKLSISGKGSTYTVSWTRPWTDKKAYYVLLCSSDEVDKALKGTPFAGNKWHQFICSRWGNENGSATIGKVSQKKGNMIYWYDDEVAKGKKTFRVFVFLPDNTVVVSDPLTYKFK